MVPVASARVMVRFVEVAGLSIVKVALPVLAPVMEILDMCYSCESGGNGSLPSATHFKYSW
jgi:hypothetical protein